MLTRLFEKTWVQYLFLSGLAGLFVYYFGWIFRFDYDFNWAVFTSETEYGHLGEMMVQGLNLTVQISLYSAVLALVLGTTLGLARLSSFKPVYYFATSVIEFFRNTPLLVQLFFWNFALPMAFPEEIRMKLFELNFEFWVATIGLGIYTAAFVAEIIRAGIQSIPKGLLEASYSSGLTFPQTLRKIILPLAFRQIIPPLGSEFLNNMKNSSLAMTVGVAEVCWSAQEVESLTYAGFEATAVATGIYLGLSMLISLFLNLVNVRLKIIPRDKQPILRQAANVFFWPLTTGYTQLCHLLHHQIHVKRAARLSYSPTELKLRRIRQGLWTGAEWAGKGGFVLILLFLVVQTVRGLMTFNFQVIWDSLPTMLWWRFPNGESSEVFFGLGGLAMSVVMSVIVIVASFFIGLVVGVGRTAKNAAVRIPATLYIELIRGNPLIMVIFWVYFFAPVVFKVQLDVFWSATIAITIFTGAYMAEIVRAGIQNLPSGQTEAAISTGLTWLQTMRKIVLPQALKQMIPAIVGLFIAIFKDTSLAYIISVTELTTVAYVLNNRLLVNAFEIYTTAAVLYFVCCYGMSLYARRLEARLSPEKSRLAM